jgi:hypothetical protein
MNYENEFCRKVYDHHNVLKNEIASAMLEAMTKAKVSNEVIARAVHVAQSVIDSSSYKMVNDIQRSFAKMSDK